MMTEFSFVGKLPLSMSLKGTDEASLYKGIATAMSYNAGKT